MNYLRIMDMNLIKRREIVKDLQSMGFNIRLCGLEYLALGGWQGIRLSRDIKQFH